MRLEQWDEIGPYYRSALFHAHATAESARTVMHRIELAPYRPPWSTELDDAIQVAIRQLEMAVSYMRDAQQKWNNKPLPPPALDKHIIDLRMLSV